MESIGFSHAQADFPKAVDSSPFKPQIPSHIPDGMSLERFNLSVSSGSDASFDIYYTIAPDGRTDALPALHLWESTVPYQPGDPAQKPSDSGDLSISGLSWHYLLLPYPQPDGRTMELYSADTSGGGLSLSIDIRVGYDPTPGVRQRALGELKQVISSLGPAPKSGLN